MATFGDATRARDGYLFYAIVPDDPHVGRILVAERWHDQASLHAHLASEEMASFVRRWRDRMSGALDKVGAANGRVLKAL